MINLFSPSPPYACQIIFQYECLSEIAINYGVGSQQIKRCPVVKEILSVNWVLQTHVSICEALNSQRISFIQRCILNARVLKLLYIAYG